MNMLSLSIHHCEGAEYWN